MPAFGGTFLPRTRNILCDTSMATTREAGPGCRGRPGFFFLCAMKVEMKRILALFYGIMSFLLPVDPIAFGLTVLPPARTRQRREGDGGNRGRKEDRKADRGRRNKRSIQ